MQIVGRPAAPIEKLIQGIGQVPRVIVPEWVYVVEFKGVGQLRGHGKNATKGRILSHSEDALTAADCLPINR